MSTSLSGKSMPQKSALTLGKPGQELRVGEMDEVSASDLLAAFKFDSEASSRAKNALLSGAHFDVWLDPVPAARLLGICRSRLRTLQRRGKPTVGAAECLTGLAEIGERGLLVAYVDDRKRAGYYFRLYLDPHPLKVVGCFGVNISPEDDPIADPE
ncbi:hypothetical protein J7F03_00935 [Streptomyces sp. ISL-43]|uniref:hypothetical protein n=1 Tax=Streptomyces sp. ISL-43 TaxID=2819183 RepID=UPI001BECD112|nr:hypothetical protein [Streptomyces sp. ISL-43]MBT2445672.1 hypothetical protein [Streptomyces sp. ISL-43]